MTMEVFRIGEQHSRPTCRMENVREMGNKTKQNNPKKQKRAKHTEESREEIMVASSHILGRTMTLTANELVISKWWVWSTLDIVTK